MKTGENKLDSSKNGRKLNSASEIMFQKIYLAPGEAETVLELRS